MKHKDEKDIQDVMREERARGKKHIDTEEIAKQKRIEKAIIEFAAEIDDEDVFRRELTSLLKPGTARILLEAARFRACASRLRDPSDNIFMDCALTGDADYLITDNFRHYPNEPWIISADKFLDLEFAEDEDAGDEDE